MTILETKQFSIGDAASLRRQEHEDELRNLIQRTASDLRQRADEIERVLQNGCLPQNASLERLSIETQRLLRSGELRNHRVDQAINLLNRIGWTDGALWADRWNGGES